MVKPIFIDVKDQEQFEKDGFVKIQLLTDDDIISLNALFSKYFPRPSADFFSSSYENDYPLKKEISDEIGKIITPNLDKVFRDYTWFGSAFLSKGNGPRSEMPMHQDWTIVDEQQFVALNIWTPLQDTSEDNGTLEVIKGSHKWHSNLRAPTLPFYFDGYQDKLKQQLTPIPTLATEAVVLNQSIIHYSKSNKTNRTRVAITTGVKSAGAPMIFHYWDKNDPGVIEQFNVDDSFLLRFTEFHKSIFLRPQYGESKGKQPFKILPATNAGVELLTGNDQLKESITNRFLKWLKK